MTHMVVGALTAHAVPIADSHSIQSKRKVVTAAIAAAFPDIDYLFFWIHPLKFLVDWHRAETHSIVMLPIWAMIIGYLLSLIFKDKENWAKYSVIAAIGLASHIATDIITVYGTQIFSPLSDYAVSLGTTFVVDGYLTFIVVCGLSISYLVRTKAVFVSQISLSLLCGYLCLQAILKNNAVDVAQKYKQTLSNNKAVATAIPQPYSPFNWKLIVQDGNILHYSFLDLAGNIRLFKQFTTSMILTLGNPTLVKSSLAYKHRTELEWKIASLYDSSENKVKQVWEHKDFLLFRQFARFPYTYRIDEQNKETCVWFSDHRYVFPELTPPFRYGMCNKGKDWLLYRLKRNRENVKVKLVPPSR